MGKKISGDEVRAAQYVQLIEHIFFNHFKKGDTSFTFRRDEIIDAASKLGVQLPRNLGDLIYSFRFRSDLPASITETATSGREWIIELAGRAVYRFRLAKINRIVPSPTAYCIKIPDATPEIITAYAKTDEQALLAKVRYNRLIDTFLRITAYSLQSHLRTSVPNIGQIEVDEVYIGVRNTGQQFIVPVQAKGGTDQIGASQVHQDLEFCRNAFPTLTPRPVAVQFMDENVIAMFELVFQDEDLKVVDEKHYKLVPGREISSADLATMEQMSG